MKKKIKLRSLFFGGMITLFFLGIIGRIYVLQVVQADELLGKAQEVWQQSKVLTPKRGVIYDRNGNILAQDAPAYTVAVNPSLINSKGLAMEVVDALAPALDMDTPELRQKLLQHVTARNQDGKFLVQREIRNEGWKLDASKKETIIARFGSEAEMNSMGVYLLEEQKRYYPANELAAHVLGYMDKDGNPLLGAESQFDEWLRGERGSIRYAKDRLGYELPNGELVYEPAVDGKSVQLTIDQNIQMYIEQALQKAYETYRPKSMTAIAVNPHTMEVLGMANMPTFNPNTYWNFESHADFYNHAVMSTYEPGSTFKIVTLAAAVEEGQFDPNATFMSGSIIYDGWNRRIHDHDRKGWGEITFLEGLKRSSNVAFVKLGYEYLGEQKLRQYIEAFGFSQPTGIDLAGEAKGNIRFRYPIEVANVTFGQGVAVTPIQQIAAVSAIANGGKLMKPHLLKAVIDSESGEVIHSVEPTVIRQVISEQSAKEVAYYLEQVVADREIGTGRRAYIEGYRIAGKTGTAQVVENGTYANDKWVASFIGFAPVENPQIALLVIADQPQIDDYRQAGEVVGPVFREIMEKSLHYLGVKSSKSESVPTILSGMAQMPDLTGKSVVGAKNEADRFSLSYQLLGSGTTVVSQFPQPGAEVAAGQRVYLLTEKLEHIGVPDFTGMSVRDTLDICTLLGLNCRISGEGYAVSQSVSGDPKSRMVRIQFQSLREQLQTDIANSEPPGEADGGEDGQSRDGETAGEG
jgi:penicillin-binding protein 2B